MTDLGCSIECPICKTKLLVDLDNFEFIDEEKMGKKIKEHIGKHTIDEILMHLEHIFVELTQDAYVNRGEKQDE